MGITNELSVKKDFADNIGFIFDVYASFQQQITRIIKFPIYRILVPRIYFHMCAIINYIVVTIDTKNEYTI